MKKNSKNSPLSTHSENSGLTPPATGFNVPENDREHDDPAENCVAGTDTTPLETERDSDDPAENRPEDTLLDEIVDRDLKNWLDYDPN